MLFKKFLNDKYQHWLPITITYYLLLSRKATVHFLGSKHAFFQKDAELCISNPDFFLFQSNSYCDIHKQQKQKNWYEFIEIWNEEK